MLNMHTEGLYFHLSVHLAQTAIMISKANLIDT